ncbi:hypothetical protein GN956_G5525 [Arapaima gigas]
MNQRAEPRLCSPQRSCAAALTGSTSDRQPRRPIGYEEREEQREQNQVLRTATAATSRPRARALRSSASYQDPPRSALLRRGEESRAAERNGTERNGPREVCEVHSEVRTLL